MIEYHRAASSFNRPQHSQQQQQPPRTSADGHRSNTAQQRQSKERQARAKKGTTKAQAMAAAGTTTTTTTHGEKASSTINRLEQGIRSKDNKDKGYSNKGKEKDTQQPTKRRGSKRKTGNSCFLQMQQLALPQPADSSAGLQEGPTVLIVTAKQLTEDNSWSSLMIDSSAATQVCPLWLAPHVHYSNLSMERDHN